MSPIAGSLLIDEIIPRLRNSLPMAVLRIGSEDIEELIQDGTVLAAQILISAESKGKNVSEEQIGLDKAVIVFCSHIFPFSIRFLFCCFIYRRTRCAVQDIERF